MAVQPLGRLPYQLINPSFHRSLMFFCLDVMDVFADFGPNVNIAGFFGVACYYSFSLRLNFIPEWPMSKSLTQNGAGLLGG